MRGLPAGWDTDLAILRLTGSTVEDRGDHLVVRTPGNPGYHWGNCLLVTDPRAVDDADRWTDCFAAEFPDAAWLAVGLPVMPADESAWARHDAELERLDVLTTTTIPRAAPLAEGYAVRPLTGDDWQLLADRDIAENAAGGEFEPTTHAEFVHATIATRRALCEADLAAWFGAFHGDDLVADLGIVRCGLLARYQDVRTAAPHRRRGLASHLLGVAAAWSAARGCESWVIVTESTNDAGRVYRRAGFVLDDDEVSAYRRPPFSPARAPTGRSPTRPPGSTGAPAGGWPPSSTAALSAGRRPRSRASAPFSTPPWRPASTCPSASCREGPGSATGSPGGRCPAPRRGCSPLRPVPCSSSVRAPPTPRSRS